MTKIEKEVFKDEGFDDLREQDSSIDKYFEKITRGLVMWAQSGDNYRSYLVIAAEEVGKGIGRTVPMDIHISAGGNFQKLAWALLSEMKQDKDFADAVIQATKEYYMHCCLNGTLKEEDDE